VGNFKANGRKPEIQRRIAKGDTVKLVFDFLRKKIGFPTSLKKILFYFVVSAVKMHFKISDIIATLLFQRQLHG